MAAQRLLDPAQIERAVDDLARRVVAGERPGETLAVIGIRRRGVPLAARLAERIAAQRGSAPPTGALDITLYRDDLSLVADQPLVRATEIDFPVDGLRVVLVDDVLFTGRTVRAAIEALFALGRPSRIELAVLVDRGHRELPIEANYAALTIETTLEQVVKVMLAEVDGEDGVDLFADKEQAA